MARVFRHNSWMARDELSVPVWLEAGPILRINDVTDEDVLTSPIYLDASALVKLLVPERESDLLNQALAGIEDVVVSDLALTETASALGRRTREGRLSQGQSRRLHREAQKLAAWCRGAETTPPVHRRAQRLLTTASHVPLRALDALHLALAIEAGAATLVTYDPRLRDAAASHGLFVAAPHHGS